MFKEEKSSDYEKKLELMAGAAKALTEGEPDLIANLANVSALIYLYLDRISWAGFYLMKGGELVLGPFQGKPACVRIKPGRGVCGTAAAEGQTLIVENVGEFPGHIACDADSRSEIVIPLFKNNAVFGVLDIDSPELNRFSGLEEDALRKITGILGFDI